MVQDSANAGGQPLPHGRPGELSPGLAGGRDGFGASRYREYRRAGTRRRRGGSMKRRNALAAGIALALIAASASAGNDFDYCLLCHGANANGNYGIRAPKLSGMEPWYLARQLENFASGARGTPAEDAPGHEMGP